MNPVGVACLSGTLLWAVAACLGFIGAAAAYGIVRAVQLLMAPESEWLIKAYRVPKEEAAGFRMRLFQEKAMALEQMRRFDAARQQMEQIVPRLVKLTAFVDQLIAEHTIRNTALAAGLTDAVERLLGAVAAGTLEPEEWERVLGVMERFEHERQDVGATDR